MEKRKQIVKQKQKASGIHCIGEVCYTEVDGKPKLRIELGKATCNPDELDRIRNLLVDQAGDTDVEWVIPTKAKQKATVKDKEEAD